MSKSQRKSVDALVKVPASQLPVPLEGKPINLGLTLATESTDVQNPTLYAICLTVSWASMYAQEPLDQSHPHWEGYFRYSEWLRERLCTALDLPSATKWEDIYRRVGCLVREEYSNETEFWEAYRFGNGHKLTDRRVPLMFERFEIIKYQIVGRD